MADIFREIEDGIRQDRLNKVWRLIRWPLLALVVVIIGAVVAYVVIRDVTEERRLEQGAQFAAALEVFQAGEPAEAAKLFQALADESDEPGYVTFSALRAAQAHVAAGDSGAAVSVYDTLAGDGSIDPLYRDLAILLAADQLIDTAPVEEISQRLAPLLSGGNVWRPMAQETMALAALKAGRTDDAREMFQALASGEAVPPGIAERAVRLLSSLGGEAAPSGQGTD